MQRLMTKAIGDKVPPLCSQDGLRNPMVYAHYFSPRTNWDWWMTEYDPETRDAFGFVHGLDDELGYFSLAELEEVNRSYEVPPIERDTGFKPCRAGQVPAMRASGRFMPDCPDQFDRTEAFLAFMGPVGDPVVFEARVADDDDSPTGWGIYYDEWRLAEAGPLPCDGGQYWGYWGPDDCFEAEHPGVCRIELTREERDVLICHEGGYDAMRKDVASRLLAIGGDDRARERLPWLEGPVEERPSDRGERDGR